MLVSTRGIKKLAPPSENSRICNACLQICLNFYHFSAKRVYFPIVAGTNMAVKKIDYDEDILTKINGFGRWQLCLFMILWLPSAFSAFAVFMYSFIAFTPDHHCKISACGDTYQAQSSSFNFTIPHIETSDGLEYDQCKQYRLVQNYRYITID